MVVTCTEGRVLNSSCQKKMHTYEVFYPFLLTSQSFLLPLMNEVGNSDDRIVYSGKKKASDDVGLKYTQPKTISTKQQQKKTLHFFYCYVSGGCLCTALLGDVM